MKANIFQSAVLRTGVETVSRPNPTLFYFPGITARPFWLPFPESTSHSGTNKNPPRWVTNLESNVDIIREEYLNLRANSPEIASDYDTSTSVPPPSSTSTSTSKSSSKSTSESPSSTTPNDEHKHRLHSGNWEWYSFIQKGRWQSPVPAQCPETARLISEIPDLMTGGIPFAFAFFSTLAPHSQVQPHFAPCNLRLRLHLPLIVPPSHVQHDSNNSTNTLTKNSKVDTHAQCALTVAKQTKPWREGEALLFDDSFEHFAVNHTDHERVVLLLDIWHPEITGAERDAIEHMFKNAPTSATGSKGQ